MRPLAWLALSLLGASAAARASGPEAPTVSSEDTAVVAFVRPPLERGEPSPGFASAVDHLRDALDDTVACLGLPAHRAQLLESESVLVRSGGREYRFTVAAASGVGAVLLSTGKPPREVRAAAGASALIFLLPDAAADYFEAPACKRHIEH